MGCTKAKRRRQEKISTVAGVVPTVPTVADHCTNGWLATDIYKGEIFINVADRKVYSRDNTGVFQINGGSITGADTQVIFFDGANNPAGEAGMTYNKTTNTLTVDGVDIYSDGLQSTVVGEDATAGADGIAIGFQVQGGANTIAIGGSATEAGTIAIGVGSLAGASNVLAIGTNTTVDGANTLNIGHNSATSGISDYLSIGHDLQGIGAGGLNIGNSNNCGNESLIIGSSIDASAGDSITISHDGGIVLANTVNIGTLATASNQVCIGLSGTDNVFFGSPAATVPPDLTINATGGSGTNIAGATLTNAAGKATGNAASGNYKVQTSVPTTTGTTLQTLGDRQVVIGKYIDVTESSTTGFASLSIQSGTVCGGQIILTIEANDGTDFQCRTLTAAWSAVNKAGTITTGISTPEESIAVSAGTLTATLSLTDSTGNVMLFNVNAVSSLTQTTLRVNAQIFKNFGTGTISGI